MWTISGRCIMAFVINSFIFKYTNDELVRGVDMITSVSYFCKLFIFNSYNKHKSVKSFSALNAFFLIG